MNFKELDKHIRNEELVNLYLFYGEEDYLKNYYKDKIIGKAKASYGNIEIVKFNDGLDASELVEVVETFSMFGSMKVIIVKNSGIFNLNKEQAYEYSFLTDVQDGCIVLFIEEKINKAKTLYKMINKHGVCCEFNHLDNSSLKSWIKKHLKENELTASENTLNYFINCVDADLYSVTNELTKVIEYKKANNQNTITNEDIDKTVTITLKTKVFALTDAIAENNSKKAIMLFQELDYMKEPLHRIFFMISRYFRLMNRTKELMSEGYTKNEIEKIIKVKPYEAYKFTEQCRRFEKNTLSNALMDCTQCDIDVKSGRLDIKSACDLIILKYSNR